MELTNTLEMLPGVLRRMSDLQSHTCRPVTPHEGSFSSNILSTPAKLTSRIRHNDKCPLSLTQPSASHQFSYQCIYGFFICLLPGLLAKVPTPTFLADQFSPASPSTDFQIGCPACRGSLWTRASPSQLVWSASPCKDTSILLPVCKKSKLCFGKYKNLNK